MRRAIVNPQKCTRCETCLVLQNCERGAIIRESASDTPWIDFYLCNGCLKCKTYCAHDAIDEITRPCTGNGQRGW